MFNNWPKILQEVRSFFAFGALVVLAGQGLLVFLARRAEGWDFTLIVIGCVLLMFFAILMTARHSERELASRTKTSRPEIDLQSEPVEAKVSALDFDVFVSSPMAALTDGQFAADRREVAKIVDCLRTECGKKKVFWAAEKIDRPKKFEPPAVSVERDVRAIEASEYFVLVYYRQSTSSVIFEAGVALALGKKCIYFVRNRNHLPFLMQHLGEVFENVRIYDFESNADIIRLLNEVRVLED